MYQMCTLINAHTHTPRFPLPAFPRALFPSLVCLILCPPKPLPRQRNQSFVSLASGFSKMRALAAALCVCLLSSCLSADLSSLSRLSAEVSAGADVEAEAGDAELQAARDAAFIEALLAQTASDAGDSVFAAGADDGGAGGVGADGAEAAPPAAMFVEVGAEAQAAAGALTESGAMSLVEMEKVHNYCEICTRMMQMFQRALPDLCSGLTDTFFISVRGGSEGARRSSGWAPPPPPAAQASPMPPPPPAVFLFATPPLSSPLPPPAPLCTCYRRR